MTEALLARQPARLVMLRGPGDVGTTRPAAALMETLLPRFPDGSWMVDLTSVARPGQVLPAIATALGLPESAGAGTADGLRRHLRGRRLLLVLDNCEHRLQALSAVGELLAECPGLAILATSREPRPIERTGRGDASNPLSQRERTVLRLVAEGLPSKQIGRELALAERTIKVHVTGAMNKLGANTRSQAVALAVGRHLL